MIARETLLRARRLASRANPRIREWSGLGDRANRDSLGLTVAEGARLVAEGLAAEGSGLFTPRFLLVSDSGAERPEAGNLFELAGDRGVERFGLSDDCFAKVSRLKGSDGLALIMAFENRPPDLSLIFSDEEAKWLVAAGVQDPGNAGALARTALAAGMTGCLFLDGADPFSPKFLRGCMGACFRFPCLSAGLAEFVAAKQNAGVRLVLAASGSGDDFRTVDYRPPLALAIGGERGVPDELARLADASARIGLHGGVESLNLAVAAGIILFQAEGQWS